MTTFTSQMIQKETQVDPILSQVYCFIIGGLPTMADPTFAPFKSNRDELTTQKCCILWGTRVVVPSSLQQNVLQDFHDTHPGMSRMEALVRSYVWWPNIDCHIESTVSSCNTCQSKRSAPPTAHTKSALNQAKRVFQCLRAINHTKTYDNVVILAPFIRKQRLFQNQDVTFVQAFFFN